MLRRRIFPIIGAVIVFIVCICVLYAGDNVGLSDNGDFRRVLLTNNIEYKDDTDCNYLFKEDYRMILDNDKSFFGAIGSSWKMNKEEEIYKSPHFLIIKMSKVMNVIGNAITRRPLSDYHIAYLAIIYVLMLSFAAWVMFTFFSDSPVKIQITVFVVFLFIFWYAGYLLYFNSFYG